MVDVKKNKGDSETVVEEILKNESPQTRVKILSLMRGLGIKPNDPFWVVILHVRILCCLVEEAPPKLKALSDDAISRGEAVFQVGVNKMVSQLKSYEQANLALSERKVETAIEQYILKLEKEISSRQDASNSSKLAKWLPVGWRGFLGGGGVVLATLVLGMVGGWGLSQSSLQLDPEGKKQLTLEQAQALDWAMSKKGQLARNIVEWNRDLEKLQCQQKVHDLGVTIELVGQNDSKEAQTGFCFLWTSPPGDRTYKHVN